MFFRIALELAGYSENGDFRGRETVTLSPAGGFYYKRVGADERGKGECFASPSRRLEELSLGLKMPSVRWTCRICGSFTFVGSIGKMS